MFKNQEEIFRQIRANQDVLQALKGLDSLTPHMNKVVEDFLISTLGLRRPEKKYDRVDLLWDKEKTSELVQVHMRIAPSQRSSYRTSKYSLSGDWTVIMQVIFDCQFTIKEIISLNRHDVEEHFSSRPWTIGKCLKVGELIYSDQ